MERTQGTVGMRVYFGRANGEKTLGEIIRVNKKNFKIRQLEKRGTYRAYNIGSEWTVPPSLCTPVEDGRPAHITREPEPVVIRPEIDENKLMNSISRIYAQLSPENLYCDGELSHTEAKRRAAALRRELKACFKALGRSVSEEETWAWYDEQRGC